MEQWAVELFVENLDDGTVTIEVDLPKMKPRVLLFENELCADSWLTHVSKFEDTIFRGDLSCFVIMTTSINSWIAAMTNITFSDENEESSFILESKEKIHHLYFRSTASMRAWQKANLVKLAPFVNSNRQH